MVGGYLFLLESFELNTFHLTSLVFRLQCSTTYMQPIVADGLAWSVYQFVCLSRSWALQKWLNRSRCRLGYRLGTIP